MWIHEDWEKFSLGLSFQQERSVAKYSMTEVCNGGVAVIFRWVLQFNIQNRLNEEWNINYDLGNFKFYDETCPFYSFMYMNSVNKLFSRKNDFFIKQDKNTRIFIGVVIFPRFTRFN